MSRPSTTEGMAGETSTIGTESACAVAAGVAALITPGPLVASTTPARPDTRA